MRLERLHGQESNTSGRQLMPASDTQLSEFTASLFRTVSPNVLPKNMAAAAVRIMRMLAKGRPVSLLQIGQACEIPIEQANQAVLHFREMGFAELDASGAVVGMILSLRPTIHHLRVNNVELFAWCAIDTLFLPPVLGHPAEVQSICGGTGTRVHLNVADGVQNLNPSSAVVSIVAPGCTPGISGQCGPELLGSHGAFCGNVLFFSSPGAASPWLSRHPGAMILPVAEAFEFAGKIWAMPFLASLREVSA